MCLIHAGRSKIAGSIGPYGAALHDGSEYTGSYTTNVSEETLRNWHTPRISALVEAGVDLLAIETIPSRVEAETLVKLLKEKFPETKAWLSFSVDPVRFLVQSVIISHLEKKFFSR